MESVLEHVEASKMVGESMELNKDLGMSKERLWKPHGQSKQHSQRKGDKGTMAGM